MPRKTKREPSTSPHTSDDAEVEVGKLFVGNLSFFCREEDLTNFFGEGVLRSYIHMTARKYRQPLLYGHVVMNTSELALQTVEKFNGKLFMGRRMRVTMWGEQNHAPEEINPYQMHVSFLTSRVGDFLVDESWLRSVYEKFGEVQDVKISRHNIQQDNSRQGGYGFVYFTDFGPFQQALQEMAHCVVEDVSIDSMVSNRAISSNSSSNNNQRNNHRHNSNDQKEEGDHDGETNISA